MKRYAVWIKIGLVVCLALCMIAMTELKENDVAQSALIIMGISMFVLLLDLLTMRWRRKRRVIRMGISIPAKIQEISYPFMVYQSDNIKVALGGKGSSNLYIIRASYIYDGKRYIGDSGWLFCGGCPYKANDGVQVYIDPQRPERFYLE